MGKRELPPRSANAKRSSALPSRYSKGRVRTRAGGHKLIDDPSHDESVLAHQLKQMGLCAAHTLGDGNCLFRSLSDQLHGTPERHSSVRAAICDYLASNEAKYKAFVDIDEAQSWEQHIRDMRQNGTYGGHLELSAFANLHRRPIKVIQPGLVYIIGHEDESPAALARRQSRTEKGKGRQMKVDHSDGSFEEDFGDDSPLYIIYHQWEHYSSVRNIDGPHTGPPCIRERKVLEFDQRTESCDPEEIMLLRKSLPSSSDYMDEHLAQQIEQHGSWENALEAMLATVSPMVENHVTDPTRLISSNGKAHTVKATLKTTDGTPSTGTTSSAKTRLRAKMTPSTNTRLRLRYRDASPATSSSTTTDSVAALSSSSSIEASCISAKDVSIRTTPRPSQPAAAEDPKPNSRSRSPGPADSPGSDIGRRQRRRGIVDSEWEFEGSGLESSPARPVLSGKKEGAKMLTESVGDEHHEGLLQHVNLVKADVDRSNELPTRLRVRLGVRRSQATDTTGKRLAKHEHCEQERRTRKHEVTKAAPRWTESTKRVGQDGHTPAALFKELKV